MKLRPVYAMLFCALLLAGCAAGEGSAAPAASSTPAAAETAPAPTAAPTPAPAPSPSPDPASLLEYTTLPLQDAKSTPASYWWDYLTLPEETARANALQFAQGLFNGDPDAVRASVAAQALTDTFPLSNLDGLIVTEFSLGGGRFETPYLSLTVADPGSTPLLPGRHQYYLAFDEEGKVSRFSPYRADDSGQSLYLAGYSETRSEDMTFQAEAWAEPADPLELTFGTVILKCYDAYWVANEDDDGHHYENRNSQDLGPIDAPPYYIKQYAVPPQGNILSEAQTALVCDSLNAHFATLADGSYRGEFDAAPGNDALLSAWDAAVPLPVSVTPESLRSRTAQTAVEIWVPLPQNCWAVITADNNFGSSEDAIQYLFGFTYYQTIPHALAAVLPNNMFTIY